MDIVLQKVDLIDDNQSQIKACAYYRRLEVLGSAATESFDPMRSDVDLLVQFVDSAADPLDEYFGLKTQCWKKSFHGLSTC